MIDMRNIFIDPEYSTVIHDFALTGCDWPIFQNFHKRISKNKCPICEVELSPYVNKDTSPTIDHFRPKTISMYPGLKCEPRNYILMCRLCNSGYKKDEFPLLDELKRAKHATCVTHVVNEEPLLLNPAEKNPIDYFELAFRYSARGGIMELKRKNNLPKDSYEAKISETTIRSFGLGYCHKNIHPNDDTKACRIDILTKHYSMFIELAKAIQRDKKTLALFLKNENRRKTLASYGFYQFMLRKQFNILY